MLATRSMFLMQRGLRTRLPVQSVTAVNFMNGNENQLYNVSARGFAKKGRKKKTESDVTTDEEGSQTIEEQVQAQQQEPEPVKVEKKAPAKEADSSSNNSNLDKSLFEEFSLGDIKRVDSTPGDKPARMEDTIEGRYAYVLFTTASQNECLYTVFEDMKYLSLIHKNSEEFRQFTENAGVGSREIALLNIALKETAPFTATTLRFLEVLAENKRLIYIQEIA